MRHVIDIKIYHTCIDVRVVDNVERNYKRMCRERGYQPHELEEADGANFFFTPDRYYVLLDRKAITHGLVVHEIYHTMCEIRDYQSLSGDEDIARLLEMCVDDVFKWLHGRELISW